MAFTNSGLVNYTRISPKRDSPRTRSIDTVSIHCMAGQLSVESCGDVFQNREASSNYGIGPDGRIGLYVEEKDRSWCTSSAANDNRAVTIEVASESSHPYKVTDAAYESLIRLLVDICQRNNIHGLKWRGDKNLIGQVELQNMTVHRWFSNKACPGDYLYNKHGEIADRVNKQLQVQGYSSPISSTTDASTLAALTTVVEEQRPIATNSSLATYINRLSGVDHSNRTKLVSCITIHSAFAVADHIQLAQMMNSSKQGYNYGIGNDGVICLFVDEAMYTPSSGNTYNDNRAVNIVVANSTGGPSYRISDECYESLIDLCEDICRRNFIYRLKYNPEGKKLQDYTFTMHYQFDNSTDCPGPYIKSIYPKIQTEVNDRLNQNTRWVTVTKRMASSESAALRVQSTISIGAIRPYVVKLRKDVTDINIDKIREVGVVGAMLEVGDYYNSKHDLIKKRSVNLHHQATLCKEKNFPFGLIFTTHAISVDDVKYEAGWLFYIIAAFPPKLGIWLNPDLNVESNLAQSIVDRFYTEFVTWGLKSKCGIYATKKQAELVGWPKQCTYMPLWLEGDMLQSNIPQEEVLTPSFFQLKSLQNQGYNPTRTVLSDEYVVTDYANSSYDSSIGEMTQLVGVDYVEKSIPSDTKYKGMKKWENYKAITSSTSYQYKLTRDPKAFNDSNGFRKIDGRFMIAVGTGITGTTGTYLDVTLENGTVIPCIVGDIKADIHTDAKTHTFTVVNDNHCCTEFIVDKDALYAAASAHPNSGAARVKKMGDCSYLTDSWKSKVVSIKVYQKNWFNL